VNIIPAAYGNSLSVIHLASLIVWVLMAGLAALLLWGRARRGLKAGPFAVLAVLLVVVDLFQAGMGINPGIPDSHAQPPTTPAVRYLQAQRPARYVAVAPNTGVNPLPPDVNLQYGIYDARGYDLPVITRFGQLWTRYVAPPNILLPLDTPAVPGNLDQTTLRVLSLFGVTDLFQQKGQPPLELGGLRVVYDGPDATIYQNENALPRTWLVADQKVVRSDDRQLSYIGSPSFDPLHVLITGRKLPGLSESTSTVTVPGEAHITRYQPEQVAVQVHANRRSELVLSDVYYPGWHATVDGRPVRIDRVDYLLRGVAVPAGSHRVEFSYDPSSFRIGWVVSLVVLLILVAMTVLGVRRRRLARFAHAHAHTRG